MTDDPTLMNVPTNEPEPRRIPRDLYLSIIGMMTLAIDYDHRMNDIVRVMGSLLKENEPQHGHVGDVVWGRRGTAVERSDELLKRLNVVVEGS